MAQIRNSKELKEHYLTRAEQAEKAGDHQSAESYREEAQKMENYNKGLEYNRQHDSTPDRSSDNNPR